MAQSLPLVGGIVGAYFGSMVGMPQLGYMLGSAAGSLVESAFFSPTVPSNALTDLQVQTSSWGAGLPQVIGTQRLAGNIIWSTDKIMVGGQQGKAGGKGGGGGKSGGGAGKKGGQQQAYYVVDIALALCEGPVGGIKRIWAGGDLIFDDGQPVYVPSTDSNNPKGGYHTFNASNHPITSTGGSSLGNWTLYHGTNEQNADPIIVANGSGYGNNGIPYQKVTLANGFEYTYGAPAFGKLGTACAYRGIAYIVFDHLNCGYGGSIPPLTFEVVGQIGTLDAPAVIGSPIVASSSWRSQGTGVSNNDNFAVVVGGTAFGTGSAALVNLSTQQAFPIIPSTQAGSYGETPAATSIYGAAPYGSGFVLGYGAGPCVLNIPSFNGGPPLPFSGAGSGINLVPFSWNGATWVWNAYNNYIFELNGTVNYFLPTSRDPTDGQLFPSIGGSIYYLTSTTLHSFDGSVFLSVATTLGASASSFFTDGTTLYASIGTSIYTIDPITGTAALFVTVPVSCSFYAWGNGWLYGLNGSTLYKYNTDGSTRYSVATGVTSGTAQPNGLLATQGGMLVTGTTTNSNTILVLFSFGDAKLIPSAPMLPAVLTAICARADFNSVDVSLVPSLPVNMTRRAGNSARDVLKVLSQVYQMDMVDSAGTLRFVPKGQNIAAQLSYDDIGFGKPNAAGSMPPAPYVWARGQGTDLPRSITLKYTNALTNYNQFSQFYQVRDDYGKDIAINVPLTLDDRTALTAAMLMCVEPHIENMGYSWSCSFNQLQYEPGDVLQLPWGVTRITQVTFRNVGDEPVIDFQGVIDSSYVINSGDGNAGAVGLPQLGQPTTYLPALPAASSGPLIASQGQPSSVPGQVPTKPPLSVGTAYGAFLEVPPLTSQQTSPFYYVAPWTTGNTFVGAAIFESTDAGVTFNQLAQQGVPGVVGWTPSLLTATQPYTWDMVSTVNVYLNASYMQLSGATDLQVIQGANQAKLGAELIQFGNAALMTDAQGNPYYQLSRLLRGRRGTESQMGTHTAGETFVLIQTGDETAIDYSLHDLNNAGEFKVATVGQNLSNINATSFAPAGLWFKPFSPSHALATVDGSSNWNVAFTPRARLNGFWGSGYAPTLDPDTQTWSADIYNGSTFKRTLTGALATPSLQYTAAMQSADGFTPGQHGIVINIYQVGQLGRGYVNTVTT